MEFKHKPVLLNECIEGLKIKPDGIYVDGTLGGAGHSKEIAKRLDSKKGLLIGIDRDEEALMAQSILARTYVISKKLKSCSISEEADICDSTHCQVYTDPEEKKKQWGSKADEYYEKIKSAVEKTADLIVSYEGVIIEYPQYFAISSGKTEEAEIITF